MKANKSWSHFSFRQTLTKPVYLAALILTTAAAPAYASHYRISVTQSPNYQTVRIAGEIMFGEGRAANRALNSLVPGKAIRLNLASGGGYIPGVDLLIRHLRSACPEGRCVIRSEVDAFAYCASACINLFMTGDVRRASSEARFGLHSAWAGLPALHFRMSGMIENSYRKHGVSAEWLRRHEQYFSSISITWLSPDQLNGSNIVTEIVD